MQETVDKQDQQSSQSLVYYPVFSRGSVVKLVQYNPIQELSHLLSLISDQETATTYQKATHRTWMLLKQTIGLLLFAFCFVIALPVWLCGIGFQTGFHFRRWLETEQPGIETVMARVLDFLSSPFKQIFAWASWFVAQYLDWKVSFTTQAQTPSDATPNNSSAMKNATSDSVSLTK
jgi:hypothetical protein